MGKPRVLIVDDTIVIRKLLTEVINRDNMLEVAGVAANGKIALRKIPQLNPDIITLDIEMPEMDGIETLKEIRKTDRKTPIIMLSSLTRSGAEKTFDALSAGATDYLPKPTNLSDLSATLNHLEKTLIPKIKANFPRLEKRDESSVSHQAPFRKSEKQKIDILAIGTSTGGPNALNTLFELFQERLSVPTVIVQHMPPVFTRTLAERLDTLSPNTIFEGEEGQVVENGCVYIAPGGKHMELQRHANCVKIHLHEGQPENSCRPAVDVLFRSVAKIYGKQALGVILTGMGQDGLRGCKALHEIGAEIYAQDKESSLIWGMPRAISDANLADKTLPLKDIPQKIYERIALDGAHLNKSAILK